MSSSMAPNDIAGLAGRLTNAQDRETYAALMCFVNDLPPSDEFRRLAELMGLLSILGQRVPDALADAMTELRELTTAASDYHAKVDERLANLPREIADGLDVGNMAEAFRQQFAATGLQKSAGLLRDSSREITALSNQISAGLAPLSQKYETVTAAIETGVTRLSAAAEAVQRQNIQLMTEQHSWLVQAIFALVLFLLGGLCGVLFEKGQTTEVLSNINRQIERLQTPVTPPVQPDKSRRKGG